MYICHVKFDGFGFWSHWILIGSTASSKTNVSFKIGRIPQEKCYSANFPWKHMSRKWIQRMFVMNFVKHHQHHQILQKSRPISHSYRVVHFSDWTTITTGWNKCDQYDPFLKARQPHHKNNRGGHTKCLFPKKGLRIRFFSFSSPMSNRLQKSKETPSFSKIDFPWFWFLVPLLSKLYRQRLMMVHSFKCLTCCINCNAAMSKVFVNYQKVLSQQKWNMLHVARLFS